MRRIRPRFIAAGALLPISLIVLALLYPDAPFLSPIRAIILLPGLLLSLLLNGGNLHDIDIVFLTVIGVATWATLILAVVLILLRGVRSSPRS